jgi:hypothetical protein
VAATVVAPGRPPGDGCRQIAEVHLDDVGSRRELVQFVRGKPDTDGSPQNPDRGRCDTGLPDLILQRECGRDPVRVGQPMRDHRGLERDDRPAGGDGIGNLGSADVRSRHALASAADHRPMRTSASVRVASSSDAAP